MISNLNPLENSIMKNKRGAFTDIFLFIILAFVIVVICIIFIKIGGDVHDEVKKNIGDLDISDTEGNNASVVVDQTLGKAVNSYNSLKWLSMLIIIGMILSILVGSYLVTTKPIFIVPMIFILILAIFFSVMIANSYEQIIETSALSSTASQFEGSNWFLLNLPVVTAIVGFVGVIIMFSRIGKSKEELYYG